MPVSQTDLQNFHAFALAAIGSKPVESMPELFDLWLLQNPSPQEQDDAASAVREGLSDIEAGRIHDFDQVNAEIRSRHGWSN